MHLTLDQITIPDGQQVLLKNITWQTFENILDEFNKTGRKSRFSYSEGNLELMSPLAVHEYNKNIISNLIEIILEELDKEFIALGSVTLKNKQAKKAIEPDACFYIQHESAIRGKDKIDLDIDPPPDLALEIDISYRSHFNNHEKLGIPELWRFDGKELKIFILNNTHYQASDISQQFPDFAIKKIIPDYLEKSKQDGRNKTMKAFRQLVISKIPG